MSASDDDEVMAWLDKLRAHGYPVDDYLIEMKLKESESNRTTPTE